MTQPPIPRLTISSGRLAAVSKREYYLASDIYVTVTNDTVVFLDLLADKYSMLVGTKASVFRNMFSATQRSLHTPPLCLKDPSGVHRSLQDEVLSELSENHMLSYERPIHSAASWAYTPLPSGDLFKLNAEGSLHITAYDLATFILSCATCKWRLTFCKLHTIVRLIRRRKFRKQTPVVVTSKSVRRLVSIYNRLRPLFPHDFLCLFDSLSLIEFLAHYNCYPDMVFAVRLDPWSAHCWVQYHGIALNEDVDEARSYLPIMII
jgi:hypothetical protein